MSKCDQVGAQLITHLDCIKKNKYSIKIKRTVANTGNKCTALNTPVITKQPRPRCHLICIGIPMFKIRWSENRVIFNMGIPIPGKDGLDIETGPSFCDLNCPQHHWWMGQAHQILPTTCTDPWQPPTCFFVRNHNKYICIFYHFSTLIWYRELKSFLIENKEPYIEHCQ